MGNGATERQPGTLTVLWRAWNPKTLKTQSEAASTIFRFFRSKHVADLRGIAILAILLFIAALATFSRLAQSLDATVLEAKTFVPSAFTVCGAVLAWTYLSASARLGIVDLFACEISTICRVGAIVDIASRYVDQYPRIERRTGVPPANQEHLQTYFVSQENYFPVFESNSRDLRNLEAQVVIDITAFYTYMKATRDIQRKLAALMASGRSQENIDGARSAALANMITMIFLGYESARRAVDNLIEYEPAKTDMTIVILITELKCYSFLIEHPDISRGWYDRVKDRESDYICAVVDIEDKLQKAPDTSKEWRRAKLARKVFRQRYRQALGNIGEKICEQYMVGVRPDCAEHPEKPNARHKHTSQADRPQ